MKKIFTLLLFTLLSVMYVQATYYVAGNGKDKSYWCCGEDWQPGKCEMTGSPASKSFTVPAGTYKFKVTQGSWDQTSYGYDAVDASTSTPGYEKDDTNVKFKVNSQANITISFDGSKITLISDVQLGDPHTVTVGTVSGASLSDFELSSTDNDTFTGTLAIGSGISSYQFKVKVDNDNNKVYSYSNHNITATENDFKLYTNNGRITLTPNGQGNYQFKFVVSTQKLSVTFPEPPTPTQHTVKVGGYSDYFNLTSSDNETFTGSINLSANYEFKVDVDGTKYSDASTFTETATKTLQTSKGRNHLTICTSGTYQFQFVVSTKALTVTYPTCPPTYPKVQVRGIGGDWSGVDMETTDGEEYTKSFALSENSTETFKLYLDTWYGNGGTMTKDNCTGWTFSTSGDNTKLNTTYAGDYLFTFIYSTKKLSVTYPTLVNPTVVTVSSADDTQGTVSPAEVEVNATHSAQITANGINGYKFKSWTLTNCSTEDELTSATINIKGDGESATGTAVASFEVDPEAKTVYFVNYLNWSTPYVYFWDPEKKSWPGDAMTKTAMTATSSNFEVWSYTYSGDYAKCKFNCGSGCSGETTNTNVSDGKIYYEITKSWYDNVSDIPDPVFITLTYVNKAGWSNVNIQMKGGTGPSMNWPGVAMTKSDDKKWGIDVYTYTFIEGLYTQYIINKGDGGGQIEKDVTADKYVHYNGARFATLDDIPLPYLKGTFNSWSTTENVFELDEDGVGSTTVGPLEAGSVPEFKVTDIEDLGNNGTMTSDACTGWTMETSKNNCKLQVRNKGEFTFTYDVKTSKLSATYPEYTDDIDMIVTNESGETTIPMTKNPAKDKEYYKYSQVLRTGDVVTFYDHYALKSFKAASIDQSGSMTNVAEITDNGLEITQSSETNFYLILESGNDKVQLQHGSKILDEIAPNTFLSEIDGATKDLKVIRPLSSASYNTLCLPFNLDASQISTYFPDAEVAEFTYAEVEKVGDKYRTYLRFTRVNSIAAGMPYIILPSEDISAEPITFNGVTIDKESKSKEGELVNAVGILTPTELIKDAYNYLFMGPGNTLYYPSETGYLKAMRSYFYVKENAPKSALMGATPKQLKAFPALMSIDDPDEGLTEAQDTEADSAAKAYKTFNDNNEIIIVIDGKQFNLAGQPIK